jgi:hypothetical protein
MEKKWGTLIKYRFFSKGCATYVQRQSATTHQGLMKVEKFLQVGEGIVELVKKIGREVD